MRTKIISVALVLVIAVGFVFAGCQSQDKPAPANSDMTEGTSPATEKPEETTPETEAPTTVPETTTPQTEAPSEAPEDKGELNVYSSRHYDVDKEVYKLFEEETGIKVNVVEGKGGELLERLSREKEDPKADLFLTVGAETIYPLTQMSLLDEFESETVAQNVPENMRGKGWSAIMYRARVIAYEKGKTDPATITCYKDLMKDEYKGKILVRSSTSSYNVALLSSFVQMGGKDKAKEWAEKIVANMARKPEGNDRDQAKAVVAGEGDLAIMNSYYFVRMANSSDDAEVKVSEKIGLIFPKKTHINLSYAGVITGAKNKANAVKFVEFLTTEKVQKMYAEKNGEFPVNPKVERTAIQKSWGDFAIQEIDFAELGKYKKEATMIFDEVKWE